MNELDFNDVDTFERAPIATEDLLILELDGFEGPLDLLLALARNQKVDIAKISVLQLADQYLAFMESARHRRLELAADYLVMAAWLTFFKSRLVLPQATGAESVGADEMAAQLRWRLARLQAMREAAARLLARDRLGRDVFARGEPEPIIVVRTRKHSDSLYGSISSKRRARGSSACWDRFPIGARSHVFCRPNGVRVRAAEARWQAPSLPPSSSPATGGSRCVKWRRSEKFF